MATVVHAETWDIRRRLGELGLTVEPLRLAAETAFRERSFCTENDPPFIPGTVAWWHAVRALREELPLIGDWRRANLGNYCLTVSNAFRLNIVVATGDAATAIYPGSPRTTSVKGLYTQAAIERNNTQGEMFPERLPEEIIQKARSLGYPTWVYLIYTSDTEVRAELSFPEGFENGEITSWGERIFVPDIDARNEPPTGDNDNGPDFDVPVRLK